MKRFQWIIIPLLGLTVFNQAQATDWWRETTLKPAYQALMDNKTDAAWAALVRALDDSDPPPDDAWATLFNSLLDQSRCGQNLSAQQVSESPTPRIVVMRKTNRGRERYQLKVAIEGRARPRELTLTDKTGRTWLSGPPTLSLDDYVEWESREWRQPLPSGLYQLEWDENGNVTLPVVIPPQPVSEWVQLDPWSNRQPVHFNPPASGLGCATGLPTLEWFDARFNRLGPLHSLLAMEAPADWVTTKPEEAQWVSFTLTLGHHQPGLIMEVQQRLTLPAP